MGKNITAKTEYPFSAIVGNELAKSALTVALSSPDVSAMLICGPKGSGKSVIARSASSLCGDRKIVVLPLGVTEDRLFGGSDLEETLTGGKRKESEGILAEADGNVLLVENINLFPPEQTAQILNAAISKSFTLERDGISSVKNSDFLLLATMDAEESPMSSHMLDRFDICVFMEHLDDEKTRCEVVTKRMEFESDPTEFRLKYAESDNAVSSAISAARSRLRYTRVPDGFLSAISEVCTQLNVVGHRGDIAVMNASCAFAALDGRDTANLEDLKKAAAICLEHRRNDPPETEENPRDNQENQTGNSPEEEENTKDERQNEEMKSDENFDSPPIPPDSEEGKEEVFEIGEEFRIVDYMPKDDVRLMKHATGKRTKSLSSDRSGRRIGYRIPDGMTDDIDLIASVRTAAPYQVWRNHENLAIVLKKEDIRERVREKKQGNNILFLVDGSGSIGAQRRMIAVKGAILSMLRDAYQKRDSIGMAVFRMDRAEEVLPLTGSILKAYKTLSDIPTGGRTPLTHGLIKGYEILKSSDRNGRPVMVILSDGRCNVPYTEGMKPVDEMLSTAESMADSGIKYVVIDTETGRMRFGLALDLCRALNGTYLRLEDLNADFIEQSVKTAVDF